MNCRPENHLDFIELKMRGWAEVVSGANEESVRTRARKNLAYLIKQYPGVAESLGGMLFRKLIVSNFPRGTTQDEPAELFGDYGVLVSLQPDK